MMWCTDGITNTQKCAIRHCEFIYCLYRRMCSICRCRDAISSLASVLMKPYIAVYRKSGLYQTWATMLTQKLAFHKFRVTVSSWLQENVKFLCTRGQCWAGQHCCIQTSPWVPDQCCICSVSLQRETHRSWWSSWNCLCLSVLDHWFQPDLCYYYPLLC